MTTQTEETLMSLARVLLNGAAFPLSIAAILAWIRAVREHRKRYLDIYGR